MSDVPMPGAAVRFDYQSLDPTTGRLYISHMNADQLVVFDTRSRKLVANLDGFPRERGKDLVLEGEMALPRGHSACVDPATHLVYFPLENVRGRPLLRIMEAPAAPEPRNRE